MKLSPDFRYYQTGIPTLDAMLLPCAREDGSGRNCRGLVFDKNVGFFGAVFGSAGSGKSILAMQMAAICGGASQPGPCLCTADGSMIFQDESGARIQPAFSAVYITQESAELVQAKILSFGWQDQANIHLPGSTKFLELKHGGLHLANFDLNKESQASMLRNIFDAVARNMDRPEERFILICFDNAETILPGTHTELWGSTPTDKNFYKAVRDFCKKRHLHLMMFFEEREGGSEDRASSGAGENVATTSQAYAADLVIRLGSNVFPSGYKERSLEIVKAKNQYHRRGAHHFSIVPGGNYTDGSTPGLVIYESLATQLYKLRHPDESTPASGKTVVSSKGANFSIPTLDNKITSALRKLPADGQPECFLTPGTVSVLVCDLDVRAVEVALHFAFRPEDPVAAGLKERPNSSEAVYISFSNSRQKLGETLNSFVATPKYPEDMSEHFVCFDPEHISEGKLLQDIRRHIERAQERVPKKNGVIPPLRVVVDNLYGLEAKFPLIHNTAHFITALFAVLRELRVIALVLDTVEVGEGRNPLDKSFAAGLAQNVFVLRHVELQSRAHTAFSVVQMLGHHTPDDLWDILNDQIAGGRRQLRAEDTFKFYKNVLSGRPELVRVRMSLHADAENSPLDNYLKAKSSALSQTLGQTLKLHRYHPDDYAKVHGAFSLARKHPLSDCHVISIDETWLEDLLREDALEMIGGAGRYEGAVTTCQDLAVWYLHKQHGRNKSVLENVYAIPDRNNCGVLASGGSAQTPISSWDQLREMKRAFSTGKKQSGRMAKQGEIRDPLFFTFCRDQAESCVSFIFELALARVPKNERLVDNERKLVFWGNSGASKKRSMVWEEALSLFVGLLEPDDRTEISQGIFRPSSKEPFARFSRQWFNTCAVLRLRTDVTNFKNLTVRDLPKGNNGRPAVVSGAWYFGILKGSAAVEAGVEAICQFTSPHKNSPGEDLRKANAGIGLPVRGEFYKSKKRAIELVSPPPYWKRFQQIGRSDAAADRVAKIKALCDEEFPFYRMRIRHYRHVMPIIWGMMMQAAKRSNLTGNEFLLERVTNNAIRCEAQERYEEVLRACGP